MKGLITWKADRDGYPITPKHIIERQAKMRKNPNNSSEWLFDGYETMCGKVLKAGRLRTAQPDKEAVTCMQCVIEQGREAILTERISDTDQDVCDRTL